MRRLIPRPLGRLVVCSAILAAMLSACSTGDSKRQSPSPPENKQATKAEAPSKAYGESADALFGLPADAEDDKEMAWHVWRGAKKDVNRLNPDDRLHLARAQNAARIAQLNQTIKWHNRKTGNNGSVTPLRDGYDAASRICRKFKQVNVIRGNETEKIGIACKNFDGRWFIVEEE